MQTNADTILDELLGGGLTLQDLMDAAERRAGSVDAAAPLPGAAGHSPGFGADGRSGEGRYEDLGLLGMGGVGAVSRVHDHRLGRVVARKSLRAEVQARPPAVARFIEEAQATAQLQHPGIIPIYDAGLHPDGRPWFTMKEVSGRTLGEVIREVHAASRESWGEAPSGWSLRRLVDALARVADALAYAHARGVVHRDLKPANVMVGEHGEVLVLDWGIAKLMGRAAATPVFGDGDAPVQTGRSVEASHPTMVGAVAGTPAYMAPEQAFGEIARPRAVAHERRPQRGVPPWRQQAGPPRRRPPKRAAPDEIPDAKAQLFAAGGRQVGPLPRAPHRIRLQGHRRAQPRREGHLRRAPAAQPLRQLRRGRRPQRRPQAARPRHRLCHPVRRMVWPRRVVQRDREGLQARSDRGAKSLLLHEPPLAPTANPRTTARDDATTPAAGPARAAPVPVGRAPRCAGVGCPPGSALPRLRAAGGGTGARWAPPSGPPHAGSPPRRPAAVRRPPHPGDRVRWSRVQVAPRCDAPLAASRRLGRFVRPHSFASVRPRRSVAGRT